MGRRALQIGLVIGLTVILTFPVTVISGAGPQKQPHLGVVVIHGGKGTGAASGNGWYQHKDDVAPSTVRHRIER
jgi:hypothetical protein